jgi:hypothetical protein
MCPSHTGGIGGEHIIVNVWRPLVGPVPQWPLAVMDGRSFDQHDTHPTILNVYDNAPGRGCVCVYLIGMYRTMCSRLGLCVVQRVCRNAEREIVSLANSAIPPRLISPFYCLVIPGVCRREGRCSRQSSHY